MVNNLTYYNIILSDNNVQNIRILPASVVRNTTRIRIQYNIIL